MPKEIAYKIVGSVLKWGSWISVIVLILGILLFLINPKTDQFGSIPLEKEFWKNLVHFESLALTNLGILLMMLVPFFRVVAIGVSFALEKDKKYCWISLGVLLFLILGIFLAISQV
ncbi:MAG TPA: DUF1634 domain-containing protein [candidate division Zixibacteria bacterium]|nr:DUF1634 domain-containing protein [candidate division Zixibacteria bacterium]